MLLVYIFSIVKLLQTIIRKQNFPFLFWQVHKIDMLNHGRVFVFVHHQSHFIIEKCIGSTFIIDYFTIENILGSSHVFKTLSIMIRILFTKN